MICLSAGRTDYYLLFTFAYYLKMSAGRGMSHAGRTGVRTAAAAAVVLRLFAPVNGPVKEYLVACRVEAFRSYIVGSLVAASDALHLLAHDKHRYERYYKSDDH